MAHLTIRVPEPHVDELRRALLTVHGRCAERLLDAAVRYRVTHDTLDAIEGTLVEVADLHHALEQLGWTGAAPRSGTVPLTADPAVFDDAIDELRATGAHGWLVDLLRP